MQRTSLSTRRKIKLIPSTWLGRSAPAAYGPRTSPLQTFPRPGTLSGAIRGTRRTRLNGIVTVIYCFVRIQVPEQQLMKRVLDSQRTISSHVLTSLSLSDLIHGGALYEEYPRFRVLASRVMNTIMGDIAGRDSSIMLMAVEPATTRQRATSGRLRRSIRIVSQNNLERECPKA